MAGRIRLPFSSDAPDCSRDFESWQTGFDSSVGDAMKKDSKGREHEDECTIDEPDVRFPVCTCETPPWPPLHLN